MSVFAARFPSVFTRSLLTRAGHAGPRRLLVIGGIAIVMLGSIIAVSMIHHRPPSQSKATRMPYINPLPGGLQSNPQQDALALRSAQEQADAALEAGRSYTPPMAASEPMQAPRIVVEPDPAVAPAPAPGRPGPHIGIPPARVPVPTVYKPAVPAAHPVVVQSSQPTQVPQAQQQAYRAAVNQLLQNWDGQAPRTDVVLPPAAAVAADQSSEPSPVQPVRHAQAAVAAAPKSVVIDPVPAETGRILMPAGRGIYAHTVLSVNSDTGGPLVLHADSGPIAGDRLIATFSKNGYDRLVVRVTTVDHRGKPLDANAIVVAPDSMETAVASSVDEHYLERLLLPAAAAFVQGLGQALATTSNIQTVLSPLGGASYATHLNLSQQLGVGAGAAAQQVGTALNNEAPKGPTVSLAANVNVGVMFLTPLTEAP